MSTAPERRAPLRRWLLRVVGVLLWAPPTAWCAMAIAWAPRGPDAVTWAAASALVAACGIVAFGPMPARLRHRPARLAVLGVAWGAVLAWFWFLPAPAVDDWLPEVAQVADFDIDGDRVTVSGIRNFRYRTSDADATESWEERTYDLERLRTVDLFFSYWGPALICHNFVSFGFERDDGSMDHVAVSIEVRKRRGQEYSAVGGLFRQFPLVYVWADERDVVRVRTNFRGERVHRYRVTASRENARILFERYAIDTMQLAHSPRWYNAVTQNCGIDILRTAWGQGVPLFPSPALLLNGTWERQAWDEGRTAPDLPFDELVRMADITEDAKAAAPREFGAAIRRRDPLLRMSEPGTVPAAQPTR